MGSDFSPHPSAKAPVACSVWNCRPLAGWKYSLFADIVHATDPRRWLLNWILPAAVAGTRLPVMMRGSGPRFRLRSRQAPFRRFPWTVPCKPAGLPDGVATTHASRLYRRGFLLVSLPVEDEPGHPAEIWSSTWNVFGHAAFIKSDGNIFAYIHPSGLGVDGLLAGTEPTATQHMHHQAAALPSEVSFPFGFPTAGEYPHLHSD